MVLITAMTGGCGSVEEYGDPGTVFAVTFGGPPGPGVSILQANGRAFGDNSACYLRFKASPGAFSALSAKGFTPITMKDYREKTAGASISGPTPSWWNPTRDAPTVFLYSGSFHPGFSRGQAIIAYDPVVQVANFYWDGID